MRTFQSTIIAFLGLIFFSSCVELSKEVEQNFHRINLGLVDSTKLFNRNNRSIIIGNAALSKDSNQKRAIELIAQAIENQNQEIESLIELLKKESRNRKDKAAVNKILIKDAGVARLKERARIEEEKISELLGPELQGNNAYLIYPENLGTISKVNGPEEIFTNLPAFAAIPILNKWKLENEKTLHSVLKYLIREKGKVRN